MRYELRHVQPPGKRPDRQPHHRDHDPLREGIGEKGARQFRGGGTGIVGLAG